MNKENKRRKRNQALVMDVFEKRKVIKKVHRRLSHEDKHTMKYVQKILFLAHSEDVSLFGERIAEEFSGYRIGAIAGPGANGAMIAMAVAGHLTEMSSQEIIHIYGDKTDEGFDIRKDFRPLIKDKEVLVVDDVLTSGGSIKKLIKAIQKAGGIVVGIAVICDRGGIEEINGIKVFALARIRIPDYPGNTKYCPGCRDGIPLNSDIGHPPK